ncbi:MAG: SLBB domain-containing protein [Rubinisphaera brasiliensis]|uniref:SLBB domain-containing protein n=1 Tax=Rubinisphaera brasiliensis TaxID=119 RepID=UPI00391B4912
MNSRRGIFHDHRAVIWTGLLAVLLTAVTPAEAFQARVIQFNSQNTAAKKQFDLTILGAVENPGCYLCQPGEHTLASLIEQAGGAKATAGQTVRIVRGGRAGVVLRYPSQAAFALQTGDIVHLQPTQKTATRVIDFSQMQPAIAGANSTQVVRPVNHTEMNAEQERGHVVLMGMESEPVVMPLWTDGLTVDVLLTRYLKQPPEVAARTRLAAGKFPVGRPGELRDGMVLSIPPHLVDRPALPRLPAAIEATPPQPAAKTNSGSSLSEYGLPEMNGGSELKVVPYPAFKKSEKATAPATSPAPAELSKPTTQPSSSVPGQDDLTLIPAEPTAPSEYRNSLSTPQTAVESAPQDSFANDLSSFDDMLAKTFDNHPTATIVDRTAANTTTPEQKRTAATSTVPTDMWPGSEFEEMLATKQAAIPHLPGEGEVVPSPVDRVEAPASVSAVGIIAGAIVIIGVLTVIVAAIRAHLFPGALLPEWVESQVANTTGFRSQPEARKQPEPQHYISAQQPRRPDTAATHAEHRSMAAVSKESALTRPATETSAAATSDATAVPRVISAAQTLPIVEEPATLPRESEFFGKPQLHYEFRIDGSHEIRRPHIAAAITRKATPAEQENPDVDEIIDRFRDEADLVSGDEAHQSSGLTFRNAADYPLDDIDTTDLFAAAYAIQAATTKRSS